MKRILWIVLTPFMIVAAYLMIFHIDWVIVPPFTNVGAEAFDHSQCQYPNRLSNPPDGCDNTDPARPECMKIGTEDCNLPNPVQPADVQAINDALPAQAALYAINGK